MVSENRTQVLIGGKVYPITGFEEENYIQMVANYVNKKLDEIQASDRYRALPQDYKSTLLELNIADDYFKSKHQIENLESSLSTKDKEIYDLKHDLISAQLKVDTLQETIDRLEQENRDLLLKKSKLEASLEDALLGDLN